MVKNEDVQSVKERFALMLFDCGAIQFGQFRLKLHETNPDAPLSPIYINLRVLRSDVDAFSMACEAYSDMLAEAYPGQIKPDYLADIPTAATYFVAPLCFETGIPIITPKMDKKTHGVADAIEGKFMADREVALFDDLVTQAHSKIEAANILKNAGLMVKNIFVLVDREQGGREELETAGYKLWSYIKISKLLQILLKNDKITKVQYDEVGQYLGLIISKSGGA